MLGLQSKSFISFLAAACHPLSSTGTPVCPEEPTFLSQANFLSLHVLHPPTLLQFPSGNTNSQGHLGDSCHSTIFFVGMRSEI